MTIDYYFINNYLEYLRNYEYIDEGNKEICVDIFRNSLKITGHITRATAVAWGSLCTYAARLLSTLGVRASFIQENIPGKGSDAHKVLALATLELAKRMRNGNKAIPPKMEDILKIAVERAEGYIGEITKEMYNDLLSMLNNFTKLYKDISTTMNLSNNIKFYAELQLLDYESHIWGTPDIIIEDPDTKKAVIVDWKTTGDTPNQREKYQLYAYAILEALRLGYKPSEVFAAIAPDDLDQTKIYYAIIRPNGIYSDHPLMPLSASHRQSKVDIGELRERLRHVVDIAIYMASLLVDFGTLCCGDEQKYYDLREQCKVRLGTGEYNALRLTPPDMSRGNPVKQNAWQCKICPFSSKRSKLDECKFYFGPKEKDLIDRLMWKFRGIVYRERESSLVPYRVLYEIGKKVGGMKTLLKDLKEGVWYQVSIANGDFNVWRHTRTSPRVQRYKHRCSVIEVDFKEIDFNREIRVGVYMVEPIGKEALLLSRDYLPCEAPATKEVIPIYGLRERQPVIIALPDEYVSTPTLGMALTAKVEQVLLKGDEVYGHKCPGVCAVVTPISTNLRFPFRIFEEYRELYGINEVFVSEIGSDLTHIDLATINSLHMMLKKAKIEGATQEDVEQIRKTVEQAWREVLTAS